MWRILEIICEGFLHILSRMYNIVWKILDWLNSEKETCLLLKQEEDYIVHEAEYIIN